jgi:hypothetical protein
MLDIGPPEIEHEQLPANYAENAPSDPPGMGDPAISGKASRRASGGEARLDIRRMRVEEEEYRRRVCTDSTRGQLRSLEGKITI